MTSSGGSKTPKNEFFGPNSDIFQPISMKLGKPVKNGKIQILVYFGRNWPPLWRHNRGSKCPKITFFDQNRSFFNQSQWNLAKMLKMEKHKFWSILAEIDPLYDVIRGSKNPQNEFFGPNSAIFQPISMKLGKPIENDKTQILVYFSQIWTPLWRHNRGSKCPKITFFDQNRSFFNQSQWNLAKMLKMEKHKFWSILAEIDPLYDVIRGSKNPQNEFFGPNSAIFQPISMKLGKAIKNGKTQILVNFDIFGPPLWCHSRNQNIQKSLFRPKSIIFQPILKKLH